MTYRTFIRSAIAAIALSAPLTANALDLSALGITMPKSGATMMCDRAPSDDAFKAFHCPLMAEAMWHNDPSILAGVSKAEQYAFISTWINAVHEPSVVWKVDPTVYGQLDPRLPMHIRYLVATNPGILGETAGEQINLFMNAGKGFLDARNQAVRNGTVDPMSEIMGMLGGLAHAPKPIAITTEIATHDVFAWIGLAQQDPDAAIQLYQGMREIAKRF